MTHATCQEIIELLAPAMRKAGELIENIRIQGVEVRNKTDCSPVTQADEQAETLLVHAIRAYDPHTLIIGEESSAACTPPKAENRFWLIDPLDGTRDFIKGGADYSVNIGLIENSRPVLGLIFSPRHKKLWTGIVGQGAWIEDDGQNKRAITTRALPEHPCVATSRSHIDKATQAYVAQIQGAQTYPSGSSLKFCLLAEGHADIYPRFGTTCEWDTAAGDAILRAAGGIVHNLEGAEFSYGKNEYKNGPFLALGDPESRSRIPPFHMTTD